MEAIFKGWDNKEEMFEAFQIDGIDEQFEILMACVDGYGYEESAFVLYQDKDSGQLYEVNGAHCSCMGFETQFEPEETSKEALIERIDKGKLGKEFGDSSKDFFAEDLKKLLNNL